MKLEGKYRRSAQVLTENPLVVEILEQRKLPHQLELIQLRTSQQCESAIKDMVVRGAPLIGIVGAFGVAMAWAESAENGGAVYFENRVQAIKNARPTAVNLAWAVDKLLGYCDITNSFSEQNDIFIEAAKQLADEDAELCRSIGQHALPLLLAIAARKQPGEPVRILTHCNAGWLATMDYGTATSPIYQAHDLGIPLHVWVDETRPRNQGANLTAYELQQHGIPCQVIADNSGGLLMMEGLVDFVIVGADRVTRNGDVANKIGTYLKALAANDNGVPFYVALPYSTFDMQLASGRDIEIEYRTPREITHVPGWLETENRLAEVRVTPAGADARNPGFDITPARLISGLITERGICEASQDGILGLYPEFAKLL